MLNMLFYLGLKLKRGHPTPGITALSSARKQRTVIIMGPKTSAAILTELPAVGYAMGA